MSDIQGASANVNNGGRSPVSGIVHSLTLLVIILLFAKWAAYVPMAAFLELQASVASFQTDKTADAVTTAIASGKLSPAMKDWGLSLCKSDPAAFAAFVDKAPVIVSTAATDLGAKPEFDGTAATLTETELSTASALGLTADQFAKSKKEA